MLYRFKVTVLETEPPIWRRILVPADSSFARLHVILQALFGWDDRSDHQFSIGSLNLGSAADHSGVDLDNERKYRLSRFVPNEEEEFFYGYDIEDAGWMLSITYEGAVAAKPGDPPYLCEAGERAMLPDNSGGPELYNDLSGGTLPARFNLDDPDIEGANRRFRDLIALGGYHL